MGHQRFRMTTALAVALGLAVLIGACTRSASTPPPATGEDEGTPSVLTSQQQTMEAVRSELLTQTAQAAQGEATETPEPTAVVVTEQTTGEPTDEQETPTATAGTPGTPFVAEVPEAYTLQEGEHPYCIARRFDVDPIRLLGVNGLDPSVVPSAGYRLIIPQNTAGFPSERSLREHPTTYTVQPGDTIYAIACMFGDVYPEAIAQANGLTEPYDLTGGTALQIP